MSQSVNEEQTVFWKEQAGPTWVENQQQLDEQLEKFGLAAIQALAPKAGERILDVGCGCGHTTLELARQVGAEGEAVGIDLSTVMIARARERAAQEGLANTSFQDLDAQTSKLPEKSFDGLCSRFGVMFFDDSVAAFRNLRGSLKANARLSFACWQPLSENPWMFLPAMAAMEHLTLDAPPNPEAPGPFAFGDAERVKKILAAAGFSDIQAADHRTTMAFGTNRGLEEVAEFLVTMGPVSRALRTANDEALTAKVTASVALALAPYSGDNGVEMNAAVWIVTARAS